jgi:hypothetical protein
MRRTAAGYKYFWLAMLPQRGLVPFSFVDANT